VPGENSLAQFWVNGRLQRGISSPSL
jgi:hypothetical protein